MGNSTKKTNYFFNVARVCTMWKEKGRGYNSCTNGFFGKITQSHHILKHFFLKLVDLVKDPLVDDYQSTYLTKQKTKETKAKQNQAKPK